jgi:hypothetical protein
VHIKTEKTLSFPLRRVFKGVKVSEAAVLRVVTQYLDLLASKGLLVFFRHHPVRLIGGGAKAVTFIKVPVMQRGVADIIIIKNWVVYGVELKGSDGKQSEDQMEWQSAFEKQGGKYGIVRSIDDLRNLIGVSI